MLLSGLLGAYGDDGNRYIGGLPLRQAELHWYEAHGIGRREFKRKRYLDRQ